MKRGLSIKTKITLWFSIILIIVTITTSFSILYVGNEVLQKTIRDNLIETVDNNLDEIEFYNNQYEHNDVDQYIVYADGYLEIDDDYLNSTNGITSALYTADGELLYGENLLKGRTKEIAFSDEQITTVDGDGLKYYIFDRALSGDGLNGLWLRGVVSSEQGQLQLNSILSFAAYIVPAFVIFSIIVGWYLAKRSLKPVDEISKTADQIREEDDLKKRIVLEKGNDELHKLADNFNNMLERLDNTFEAEKQFTSNVSHELKTPVSVILAQCELSLSDNATNKELLDAIRTIERQGKKMDNIISDMLTSVRLDSNSSKLRKERLDFSQLTSLVCLDMKYINEKNIEFSSDIEEDIYIYGNRELLSRMLNNLISNAYKYGRENGHIIVALKKKDNTIALSVKDDGIGISDEDKGKVFNRFYQVDPSHSRNGAGLGLTLASEIARFHNGKITLESELDKGSTFTFTKTAE